MLPPPYQLDPSLGSYYSNVTGFFRGDTRYYNLSSIPYDTNVTWKPTADHIMENANLSAIPERLGTWNWSAADSITIKVHDRMMAMTNVSESIAIFQVLCSSLSRVCLIPKIILRGSSSYSIQGSQKPCFWSSMEYTSRRTGLSMRLLKGKGGSHYATPQYDLFDLFPVPPLQTFGTSQASFLSVLRTLPQWFCKMR